MTLMLPGLMALMSPSMYEEVSVENIWFKPEQTYLGRVVKLAQFSFYSIFGAVRVSI